MIRSKSGFVSTAAMAVPISTLFLGATTFSPLAGALPAHAAAAHAVQGPATSMRWGPVQVTIIVQGKRITDIKITAPKERPRSALINNHTIPLLRKEALQAQTAKVQLVSGATMTSKAFVASLQAAIAKAHL
jgi:uncharacterized protein with FMN-binding domain